MESVSANAGSASGGAREALQRAIVVDTEKVRGHLDEMVRSTVEQTLNKLLDEEANRIGKKHLGAFRVLPVAPGVSGSAIPVSVNEMLSQLS